MDEISLEGTRISGRWYGNINDSRRPHRAYKSAPGRLKAGLLPSSFPNLERSGQTLTMAEAVGLAASIIAVGGVATAALNFVKEVKSFARDLKSVREELRHSVGRIGFTARNINNAQNTLLRYCKDKRTTSQSAVINYIETQNASTFLSTESSWIKSHVRQLLYKIESLLSIPFTLWVNWKWRHSLRSGIDALQSSMLFMQSNLNLILNTIQLELALRRTDKDEIDM